MAEEGKSSGCLGLAFLLNASIGLVSKDLALDKVLKEERELLVPGSFRTGSVATDTRKAGANTRPLGGVEDSSSKLGITLGTGVVWNITDWALPMVLLDERKKRGVLSSKDMDGDVLSVGK